MHTRTPLLIFGLVSVLILGPLLLPGYVLTLDMSWPPRWEFPTTVANGYPLYVLLTILNFVLPSMVLQKIILWGIFVVSGYGMYRLVRDLHERTSTKFRSEVGYLAGLLYMINPFTYDRFMDGQWLVLIGYAFLPVFTLALLKLLDGYTRRRLLWLAGVTIAVSYTSIHTLYMLLVIAAVPIGWKLYDLRSSKSPLVQMIGALCLVIVITLIANFFWFAAPNGLSQITDFDMRHALTFRSVGHGILSAPFNLLTLGGYWGEAQGRFVLAKSVVVIWPILIITILGLVGLGIRALWPQHRKLVITLGISGLVGWILSVGVSAPVFREVYLWLVHTLPLFQGFREPQKFIALLVLTYAVLASFGASRILASKKVQEYRMPLVILLLALPILYTPTLLWGGFGQLRAVDYPSDWYALDRKLDAETPAPSTVFLPWHQYLYLDFAGRTVASPAKQFFRTPIIQNDDPALGLIDSPSTDTRAQIVDKRIVRAKEKANASKTLTQIGVKYIVVSKTADWRNYSYLSRQPDLTLISDTNTLLVYRNDNLR
jgi:hypothetical protein